MNISQNKATNTFFFLSVTSTVLPIHPALTGHPLVHPRLVLALHSSSTPLL